MRGTAIRLGFRFRSPSLIGKPVHKPVTSMMTMSWLQAGAIEVLKEDTETVRCAKGEQ